jgi:DNA repair exonuclease SbcCD ATPase subunit
MIFTWGDFIVLGVVLLILYTYRRLDKNSKTLENVRRYAEKASGELDALVEQKKIRLKDLVEDMDVQERTGREVLKRVVSNNEELAAYEEKVRDKLSLVDNLQDRMDQLNDMAALVDENMRKVADESSYVDSVGSRLNESRVAVEEVDRRLDALHEDFSRNNREALEEIKSSVMEDYQARLNLISEQLKDTVLDIDGFRSELNGVIETHDQEKEARIQEFSERVAQREEEYREKLDSAADRASLLEDEVFRTLEEDVNQRTERLEKNWLDGMNDLKAEVASLVEGIKGDLDEGRDQIVQYNSEVERLSHNFDSQLNLQKADVQGAMAGIERMLSDYREKADKDRDDIEMKRESFNREQEEYQGRMDQALSDIRGELDSRLEEVKAEIENRSQAAELETMKGVEQRYAEYDDVIRQRYERLDGFSRDMEELETSLRETMGGLESRFREDMESFSNELEVGQNREKERSDGRLAEIHVMIGEIEKELNQLKQQAYENVSEKLQLFEDDFFTDLKKRESAMQESLSEWRKNVELQLDDLGSNSLRDREEVERSGMAQITRKMSELQTRVVDQFDKFQEQVKNFQGNVTEQIEAGEKNILDYRQIVRDEWEKNRNEAMDYLGEKSETFASRVDGRLEELQTLIDGEIEQMAVSAEAGRSELTGLVEKARADGDMWQHRLSQQLSVGKSELEGDLDEFRQSFAETVVDLKNTFAAQKDELVISSNKDRVEVRKDISDLFERISSLNSDLHDKSEQTLDIFNEKSEQYLIDYQQRFRQAQNDSDEKIKLMRSALADTKDKMESYQNSVHNRIDESYRELLVNVEKIEEKQQDFINQTHIFEKADSLRKSLESDIAQLQEQVRAVSDAREDIVPVREECARVLKIYDSVTEKTSAFLAEQQKIDLLDGKVARIINLSDAIDMKLDHVSETDDTMQSYIVKLHQLEDLHKEISRRFKEVEKKSSVVDAITQSVDRNFEMLGRIEEGLSGINDDLVPLRSSLHEVKRNSELLLENKGQVDYIVNNVTNLDSAINDFEGRMKKMDKAREWLAGTETRLENISREAQEKVKLLGNLASREVKKGSSRSSGSPDMNTRDMVIQLARQGWSSEEISRYVKLSRGEVELILELSPSGNEE